jgi:5-methylthioadenosine/S-adenosylhomocysteine deaminase
MRTYLDNARIVTMNARDDVVRGGVLVDGDTIAAVVTNGPPPAADRRIDLGGHALLPGFVQSHVHCCQTLFRGAADDLPLLDWLKRRIWPLEAAHDARSLEASARLTALELLLGGTTAFLSMETVRDTEAVLGALDALPVRAVVGKCMMDAGDGVPAALLQTPDAGLRESLALARAWPGGPGRRVRACLAPRFAVSCSDGLLRDTAAAAREHALLVHTHGAEQREEVELVKARTGRRNVAYLADVGLAAPFLRLAHAIHLDDAETDALRASGGHVLHCPSSNLKLGSGIAPIHRYLSLGIPVSIGADGAPCNNNLDALREARLAALLQKPLAGPTALPARTALDLITRAGARALGLEAEIGTIAPGFRADLVEIDLDGPHVAPGGDVVSDVVYAATRQDIVRVFFAGEVVVERGRALFADAAGIVAAAREQAAVLFARAGLSR